MPTLLQSAVGTECANTVPTLEQDPWLPLMTENEDPDRWFMDRVMKRAVRLWKGEQVDGSVLEWGGSDANGYYERVIDILQSPCAVMAGYRYITSLKSTPRHLRAPMHESLFR